MRQVLLAHGINSNGDWQNAVGHVLEPHFEVVKIRFWQYRGLGAFKLVFEPWALILVGAVTYFLAAHVIPIWLAIVCGVVGGMTAAYLTAPIRRRMTMKRFVKEGGKSLGVTRPHIIAHSFGTLLTGWVLKSFPGVKARRIVLVGCVLREDFNWLDIYTRKTNAFDAIRNEWTNQDSVVKLAGLIRRRIPDFGQAGLTGFTPVPNWIHSVASPDFDCVPCTGKPDALIHNYDCSGLGHSDAFIGAIHASRYWLPFLWARSPQEYGDLLDCCEAAAEAFENSNTHDLKIAEDELLVTEWEWTYGQKFEDYLVNLIKIHPNLRGRSANDLAGRAAGLFWRRMELARRAAASDDGGSQKLIKYLRPELAATAAIEDALAASR
jgi:pimeloyl-ACP methyl ester carboxylesterase